MKSRLTYFAVAIMVIASMLLTACGPEASPTTAPAATATTAPAAAATDTTAPAAGATNTAAPAAGATNTTAPVAVATNTTAPVAGGADASPTAAPTLPPAPTGAKVLRVNTGDEPATTDPQKMSFVDEIGWGQLVFEGLYALDQENLPIPAAAEGEPQISEDGLTYTIKVKEGLTYSDGTPLTAENFEWAWKRAFDPRVPDRQYPSVAYVIKGSAAASEMADISDEAAVQAAVDAIGVEATDDTTIVFTLENQAAYFPFVLTLWLGWPSRQDMVEQGGESWTEPATYIGNGPFVLDTWQHASGARFRANENYRLGKPALDFIEYRMINNSAVAFEAYKAGELDAIGVAAEDLAAAQTDPELSQQFEMIPGNCTFYLGFNLTKPPFDNLKVRQAFIRAIDREDWVEVVLNGLGTPAYSFIPPDRPGYNPDVRQPEFDPEEAKRLLDEAIAESYPNGLPQVSLGYSSTPRNQTRNEWVQNQLKTNLGLDVRLEPFESTTYTDMLKDVATTPQVFILGWCQDYPDPQNWLSLVFQGSSTIQHNGWKNAEFDRLTSEADVLTDFDQRMELYNQAHQILLDDAPVMMFWHDVNPVLIKPYVTGMREFASPSDNTVIGFKNIMNIDLQR